jgi:hypothetical protein
MLYNINVDLGKSNVDSKRNVELRYTHVSAVKFTPELVEQKLLPTENYLKNRVVFRTKFYATFWNNFYPLIFTV